MAKEKEKLLYLESLRGFAAIIVALYHANFMFHTPVIDIPIVTHGALMVDFFFVLSGFVIAYNYQDRLTSLRSVAVFQARRFLRLYPLHLLLVFLFVGVEVAKYVFELKSGVVANNPAFSQNDWGAFIGNIFLTHSFTENDMTFNDPSWSISAEFYTYLIFAAVIYMCTHTWVLRTICAVIVCGAGAYLYATDTMNATTGAAIIRCIYGFFIGVVVCFLCGGHQKRIAGMCGVIALFLGIVSLCFVGFFPVIFYPLIFGCVIMGLFMARDSVATTILNKPFFVFFGTISYGIYMWHAFVWWFLNNGLKYGLKIPVTYDPVRHNNYLQIDLLWSYGLIFVGLLGIFILAYLSYRFVEKPMNEYRHKFPMQ